MTNNLQRVLPTLNPTFAVHAGADAGDSGEQVAVKFLAASPTLWNRITTIWVGHHDMGSDVAALRNDTAVAAMVEKMPHGRFLIISAFSSAEAGWYLGGAEYGRVLALNTRMAAAYGSRFLDARTPLVDAYNPSIPQDVTDHGNDIPPSSLRQDVIDLTDAGTTIVCNLVTARLRQLGWVLA